MSETVCTYTKPDGSPCAAHPLPDSSFCLFHDPAHAQALAEARAKGGAAPRRARRYPILLDHLHVAELLSELFIEALNHTDPRDTARLRALTSLSRALLQAVGTPPTFLYHRDRNQPRADLAHLLRRFSEEPTLPRADAATPVPSSPQSPTPNTENRTPNTDPPTSQPPEFETVGIGNHLAWEAAVAFLSPHPYQAKAPEQQNEQGPEQAMNRLGTSPSATTEFLPYRQPSARENPSVVTRQRGQRRRR